MNDSVTVFSPLIFADSINQQERDESDARDLALNTIKPTFTKDWNVLTSKSFTLSHKECDCVIYKYNLPPPKIKSNFQKEKQQLHPTENANKRVKIYWCMASTANHKTSNQPPDSTMIDSFRSFSPSDNTRHKTILTITAGGLKTIWHKIWKTLCKSLQHGELVNCNAYYKENKEIVIYHDGIQQANVGEWIWKNISCEYSKKSYMVLM